MTTSARREPVPRGEAGETLAELIVTIAIIGIGLVAIMYALGTTLHTGTFNRSQGKANAVLSAASEFVKAHPYYPCSGSTTTLTSSQVPQEPGFVVTVSGPDNTASPGLQCGSGAEAMKVTVTVPGANGIAVSQYVPLFCRKPMSAGACPP